MKIRHLIKKGNNYYYKRKIPNCNSCLTVSLKTDSITVAKYIVIVLNFKLTKLYQQIGNNLNNDELKAYTKELLKKYVLEAIIEYEALEELRHEDFTYINENGIELDGGHPDSIDKALKDIKLSIFNKEKKDELVDRILPRTNITNEELKKIPQNKLSMFYTKLLKAENEILRYDQARNKKILEVPSLLKSEFEEFSKVDLKTPYEDKNNSFQEAIQYRLNESKQQYYKKTLPELKDEFLEHKIEAGIKDPKRYDTGIQMLIDITEKEYVVDIRQDDMKEFVKILKHLPDKNKYQKLYKEKSYREIFKLYDKMKWEKLAIDTINNKIINISAFLTWCVEDEYLDVNRLANKKTTVASKRNAKKWERVAYTNEDLERLFQSDWYTKDLHFNLNNHPDKIFAPLLGLYQGFRINELCSLYIKDIIDLNGIICINIEEDEHDKHIKGDVSERLVPMHPKLIDIGFLDFVNYQKKQGYKRVFQNLYYTKGKGYGQAHSKKFNRKSFKKTFIDEEFLEQGAKKRKDFHSFRHTFSEMLKGREDIPDGALDYLNGHANDSHSQKTYGKHQKNRLLKILSKLEYNINLDTIKNHIINIGDDMVDFSKLDVNNTIDTILSPRDLFTALPNKNSKYQFPRDVQTQVWNKWFGRRNEKDLVLKMNTGSGKTVVGLILLKSSLNENKGPAIYLLPNNFLVQQVISEASELGIKVTTEADSSGFIRGNEILVCTIHKLINGRSIFGINQKKIDIGSIIIDDAHACIETVEQQYTIQISKENPIYNTILQIFLPSIKTQSESKAIELENNHDNAIALIPFWSWKRNIENITRILLSNHEHNDLKFSLPLLKDNLNLCRCVISTNFIEITPHAIPINIITSLEHAKRRIFMTATLIDDSILTTHFNLDENAIVKAITPETAGDIGERMILIPQELNPLIKDDELKQYYKKLSNKHNVVIIVPSFMRASYWSDVSDLQISNDNIETEIENMKNNHVGLVIIVNRYDGIDLPKDACRILIIDGLPDSRRLIDQITESQLTGSDKSINQKIQKIEQGMGRGVRSNDDYCIIFLMGKNLIKHLYSLDTINKFSQATKAQFRLSEDMSKQLMDESLDEIDKTVQAALDRNTGWVSVSKGILTSLEYLQPTPDKLSISFRLAYNSAVVNQFRQATIIIQEAIASLDSTDKILLGYAKQTLAEYVNYTDEIQAQEILLNATSMNQQVLKPIDGISYSKIKPVEEQANQLQKTLLDKYNSNKNQLIIDIDAILEELIFIPDTSNKFEEAIKELGFLLGFTVDRPENNYGRGPDNLWVTNKQIYFIIECKNGVTNETINKHDINQLNGSFAWYQKEYHNVGTGKPFMIHKGNKCEHGATPLENCTVMTEEKLNKFKTNIKECMNSLKDRINDIDEIKRLLTHYRLRDIDIIDNYTEKIKII